MASVPSIGLLDSESASRRGPLPGATREEVLARATATFLACERIDLQALASECGIGRATLYRWFGSREGLIGEAMVQVVSERFAAARRVIGGRGAEALLGTFDLIYRGLVAAPHVRAFIDAERATALTLMTSSSGPLHPRMVELVRDLIDAEVREADYRPPSDPTALAYVLVRLTESLLFNYVEDDLAKDIEHLQEVVAALLGVSRARGEARAVAGSRASVGSDARS